MLRTIISLSFFFPWTILCTFSAMLTTFVDKSGRTYHQFALLWSRYCLAVAGVRLSVEGAELVPRDRPVILMGNHQSNFDIPVMFQAAPVRFNWLAKEELFKLPVFGPSLASAGYIPVNRNDGRDALRSLSRAAALVEAGTNIAIFPEGTRSPDGDLIPFKRGGFILAEKAGVPIIPVSITDSREIQAPGRFLSIRPGRVRVRFGAPIPTRGGDAQQGAALVEQVRAAIAAGLEH
jgi:1-acyl-sn-glycerol-3-phosphate acyltransferase